MAPEPRQEGIAARATLRYATAVESLARLQAYLPVGVRQSALAPPLRCLHREILRALAIGPMFGHTASVRSRCHGCGASIALEQDDEAIAPAHVRVIRTLRAWDIRIDEALFLGGLPKGEFLKAFRADIFFDDQLTHCESARTHVPTGHVPHGVANELSKT